MAIELVVRESVQLNITLSEHEDPQLLTLTAEIPVSWLNLILRGDSDEICFHRGELLDAIDAFKDRK